MALRIHKNRSIPDQVYSSFYTRTIWTESKLITIRNHRLTYLRAQLLFSGAGIKRVVHVSLKRETDDNTQAGNIYYQL